MVLKFFKAKEANLIKHESAKQMNLGDGNEKSYYTDGTIAKHLLRSKNSFYYAQNIVINRLPTFHFEELGLKDLLGYGSFCEVYEVISMKVLHKSQDGYQNSKRSLVEIEDESDAQSTISFDSVEERLFDNQKKFIAKNCKRTKTGDARFVIKYLSPDIVADDSSCAIGAVDLAMEVMVLSNLSHPNIIKIRGVSATEFDKIGSAKDYFIILDRLYDTVEQKLPKWKKEIPTWGKLNLKNQNLYLAKRLVAAYDLASALQFIHKRKIIYRDLKAQNCGFDASGVIKLFDFGLARELKEEDKTKDGNYKLTSNTGTRRYMAPEVVLGEAYNLSADIYSYSILLWEICAMKRAFSSFSFEKHYNNVILGNTRPSLKTFWPSPIKKIFKSMWSINSSERPDFEFILPVFEKFISKHIDVTKFMACHRRSSFFRLSVNL